MIPDRLTHRGSLIYFAKHKKSVKWMEDVLEDRRLI
jgi:hypothetical protein